MKVLFFTAWYPHRYDAMAGLFVRKHAAAVAAQGVDVAVFYIHEAPSSSPLGGKLAQQVQETDWVEQETDGVREFYAYYSAKNKLATYTHFWKAFLDGYHRIEQSWGRPDITQANVIAKNAWCSYYLYKKYAIPYIIVEHWSGYLPANGGYKGFFHKRITEHIARHAKAILPVSPALMEAMKAHGIQNRKWDVINNVVDDFFYSPHTTSRTPKGERREAIFLHVSCFDEAAKNTCGLLRATAALYQQRQDFRLIMVGTGQDIQLATDTAAQLGLSNIVTFTGEVTPQQVADYMYNADTFVLFSNYENAPVVISECLAVGLPIISSRVGFVPLVITPDVGRIVEPKNEDQLTETMSWFIDHIVDLDPATIRKHGAEYSFEAVGKTLLQHYRHAITQA